MKVLGLLHKELNYLKINNEFYEWTSKVKLPYWVYDYIQDDLDPECGLNSGVIILNGFSRKGLKILEDDKNTIINHFKNFTKYLDGVGFAITVNSVQYRNTNDEELKNLEIKLEYKEWSV